MELCKEDVDEFVKFFERHVQYWKRSVFLGLLAENLLLNKEVKKLRVIARRKARTKTK